MYEPVNLPSASSPPRSKVSIDNFLGADLTSEPANVDTSHSPDCPNMIRDVPGKVRKRMGWAVKETYTGKINGCYKLNGDVLIHAGTKLYKAGVEVYTGMADARGKSWELNEKLYIADGLALLVYDGSTVKKAQDIAYVPTKTIARAPNGGGTSYEALNLLQPKFTETFLGVANEKNYQLSFGGLDAAAVTVKLLQSNGSWVDKVETTDFTVNRQAGIVTFITAPGASPVAGQDNVSITASRTVAGYADRVNKCSIGIAFGVSGAQDRLFLSGNPDLKNYDWYSGLNDPTYFGDTSYAVLGQSDSAVVGYSIVSGHLAAHKNAIDAQRTVIVRSGNLVDNKPAFQIYNTLQGEGAIGKHTFASLANEPVFLTRLGIYAITAQDITGEKLSNLRSYYINGGGKNSGLLQETGLDDAYAIVYKDMYWLCINNKAYILDGLQPTQQDRNAPYSNRQYVGFFCTNIPARVLWEHDGALWFGTADGKVCKFFTEPASLASYNDNGAAISAHWRTPDIGGKNVYRNKSFKRFYVELAAAVATSFIAKARISGLWETMLENDASARYFSFSGICFSKFSWSPDSSPKVIGTKINYRKLDKMAIQVENSAKDEPFGLNNISLEFVESGYYKGG